MFLVFGSKVLRGLVNKQDFCMVTLAIPASKFPKQKKQRREVVEIIMHSLRKLIILFVFLRDEVWAFVSKIVLIVKILKNITDYMV